MKLLGLALLCIAASAGAEPLKVYNGRLFITVKVNGVATEALLDSGAEGSIFDPAFAAKAKFPTGTPQVITGSAGAEPARIVEGVTISALGTEIHPEAVVVLDLTD